MSDGREELWDGLSVIEDWIGGGMRQDRARPAFAPLAAAAVAGDGPEAILPGRGPCGDGAIGRDGPAAGAPRARKPEAEVHAFLDALGRDVEACRACRLSTTRSKSVPGTGAAAPRVLVVGEGPGAEEDASGLPFVGPAGQLLDRMLAAIGLSRGENVYIANVVKCRPPGNRDPAPDEVEACSRWLESQVDTLAPEAILCLGRSAMRALTRSEEGITRMRGRWLEYRGVPLMPTFHPSALLRDETLKRPAWEDLKALKERLDSAGAGA